MIFPFKLIDVYQVTHPKEALKINRSLNIDSVLCKAPSLLYTVRQVTAQQNPILNSKAEN